MNSITDFTSSNSTCPAFDVGYDETVPWVYNSFVLVDPSQTAPKLGSADNSERCFPFPSLASNSKIVDANLPQTGWSTCVQQPLANNSNAVCAFVYNASKPVTNLSTCINRTYQLQTFSSRDAAVSAGAVVTHTGGKV